MDNNIFVVSKLPNEPYEKEPKKGQMLLYIGSNGSIKLEVRLEGETLWLTINQMAELFEIDKSGISRHLKNIYETGELRREATVANFATVQNEGSRNISRELEYYNLDAIISVGYRVNSIRGTQFRVWAAERLKEYIIKGFALDDARLKEPKGGDILKNCLPVSATFDLLKRYFGERYLISMRPVLIMIPTKKTLNCFFNACKIKFIGRCMATPRLS